MSSYFRGFISVYLKLMQHINSSYLNTLNTCCFNQIYVPNDVSVLTKQRTCEMEALQ